MSIGELKFKNIKTCKVCTNPMKITMKGQLHICSECIRAKVEDDDKKPVKNKKSKK